MGFRVAGPETGQKLVQKNGALIFSWGECGQKTCNMDVLGVEWIEFIDGLLPLDG